MKKLVISAMTPAEIVAWAKNEIKEYRELIKLVDQRENRTGQIPALRKALKERKK